MSFAMSHLVLFYASADAGRASEYYVRLATDPALANVSGAYFVSGRAKPEASAPSHWIPLCSSESRRQPRHSPS